METLEQKIGYKFQNSLLLGEALTHPSLAYETSEPHFDNQRLEFLGDAVIQLALTHELFRRFTLLREGPLTKIRARLVSRQALAEFAGNLGLGEFLLIGKGEAQTGGRERPSTLADCMEALVGAIYLDGGFEPASEFFLEQCSDALDQMGEEPEEDNPKGKLQELLQAIDPKSPVYRLVSAVGPDHDRIFTCEVSWRGETLGSGKGGNKKLGEANAAVSALEGEPLQVILESAPEEK